MPCTEITITDRISELKQRIFCDGEYLGSNIVDMKFDLHTIKLLNKDIKKQIKKKMKESR